MALEIEKSPFDASLSMKARHCGRWTDRPALGSQVCQPSEEEDDGPLPSGTKVEEVRAVEKAGPRVPGVTKRNQKYHEMSSVPSSRFCKIKAKVKYGEREPLVGKASEGGVVPHQFSRTSSHPEEQKMNAVKSSNSAKLLQDLLERPGVLPMKAVDSAFYNPTAGSRHSLDAGCRSQVAFAPSSSTPKRSSCKRDPRFDASVPMFPQAGISLQPPEGCDFEWQERARSKSFSTSGAASSPETSAPWYRHNLSDPEETSMLGTHKPMPMDCCSLVGQVRKMSSFQADYWACAIPDSLPPSPDRQSPHWNPNKEYEDLLDYTYPLRPKYKLAKNPKDSTVHDSGVDLDSFSISPESTLKSVSVQDQEHPALGIQSAQRVLTPLLKKLECSAPVSHYRLSPIGKVSFVDAGPSSGRIGIIKEMAHGLSPQCASPGPSDSTSIDKRDWNTRGHNCLRKRDAASSNFIRSTRMLPLQTACSSDEEYLSLPPRLKELETLAQQLTDLSLTIRKPEHSHARGDLPCISVNGQQLPPEDEGNGDGDESLWKLHCDSCHTCSFQEHSEEGLLSNQGCNDQESMQGETACTGFLEAKCLDFLERGSQHVEQEKTCYRDSLAQRIKIFCCQLEELICWLHKVAEVTDNWIPPKPDIESVKASLQNYLEFKKDLAGHQALSEGVLQDGERLLQCMASNSPVLQGTLGWIAKQSNQLEGHATHLYESVLAAMDTLSAGLMKNCDAQPTAAQAESSKWIMPPVEVEFGSQSLTE